MLSEWRVELLEAIDAHGSLSRAAASLNVPYRTAWERVKETEAELGVRLLESESGGTDGGGSRLTPEARDLCHRFRRVSGGIQEVVTRRFVAEFGELANRGPRRHRVAEPLNHKSARRGPLSIEAPDLFADITQSRCQVSALQAVQQRRGVTRETANVTIRPASTFVEVRDERRSALARGAAGRERLPSPGGGRTSPYAPTCTSLPCQPPVDRSPAR